MELNLYLGAYVNNYGMGSTIEEKIENNRVLPSKALDIV